MAIAVKIKFPTLFKIYFDVYNVMVTNPRYYLGLVGWGFFVGKKSKVFSVRTDLNLSQIEIPHLNRQSECCQAYRSYQSDMSGM